MGLLKAGEIYAMNVRWRLIHQHGLRPDQLHIASFEYRSLLQEGLSAKRSCKKTAKAIYEVFTTKYVRELVAHERGLAACEEVVRRVREREVA